jgi:hypothetical protein
MRSYIAVSDLVRYVFKTTNLGKKDLGVPQLLNKRYILFRLISLYSTVSTA